MDYWETLLDGAFYVNTIAAKYNSSENFQILKGVASTLRKKQSPLLEVARIWQVLRKTCEKGSKPIEKSISIVYFGSIEEIKKTELPTYWKRRASEKLYLMLYEIIALKCEKLYSLLIKSSASMRQQTCNSCKRSIDRIQKTISIT